MLKHLSTSESSSKDKSSEKSPQGIQNNSLRLKSEPQAAADGNGPAGHAINIDVEVRLDKSIPELGVADWLYPDGQVRVVLEGAGWVGRPQKVPVGMVFRRDGTPLIKPTKKKTGRKPGNRKDESNTSTTPDLVGSPDDRPEIEITTDHGTVLDQTLTALARDQDLYCRGGFLGIVTREENDSAKLPGGIEIANARGSMRFVPLAQSVLGCQITRNAKFYAAKENARGDEIIKDCHVPNWLISAVFDHRYWPGIRQISSIAEVPFVRPGGSLLDPGFDQATGTFYHPSIKILPIPDRPSQDDAREAAERLFHVVRQFPFADESNWSVWLAGLLTAIQRPMIHGPVPGFVLNANKAGCGKGLLIDVIGIIVWGYPIPTRDYPTDNAEAGKVKLSLALSAVPVVHFDNLTEGGSYGGSSLDSALTSMITDGRILGYNRDSGPVPIRPCWFLSGNNISPFKDAHRRWLPCNLVTMLESPHERDDIDKRNLRDFVHEQRAELLGDAHIILKAHATAAYPASASWELGSYEEWDEIVRGAVWYATGYDCLLTQQIAASEMPGRVNDMALLEGWKEIDPYNEGKTVDEVIKIINLNPLFYDTLRNAIMELSNDSRMPALDKIRFKLRSMHNTPVNGLRFEKCGENRNHQTKWRVVGTPVTHP